MRELILHAGVPGERRYPLVGTSLKIGRTDDNDIVMSHMSLSREHAFVVVEDGVVTIVDRDSKNGTWVNGNRVERAVLHHGDRVRLGELDLRYSDGTPGGLKPVESITIGPRPSHMGILRPGPSGLNLASDHGEQRDREKLQILLDLSEHLLTIGSLEGILQRVVDLAAQVLDADRVVVLLADGSEDRLVEGRSLVRAARLGPTHSRSIAAGVARSREATLYADPSAGPTLDGNHSIVTQEIRSAMAAPLVAYDRLQGVLYVDNLTRANRYTREDLQFLVGFANLAALAIDNAAMYERAERESALRQNLLRFFPDAVAHRLLSEGPSLAPFEVPATALFCDLVDFTGHGERQAPRELLDLLQVYLQEMTDAVFQEEGTMEKYIGDALMAVWGAPYPRADDAQRAVRAAVAMQRAMVRVNERLHRQGLAVHIGLNTGIVCAGNIGSTRYLQYAAIGDATSVAARVCGVAKGGEILLTEATRRALGTWSVPVEGPTRHSLKGKTDAVELWRVRWEDFPG